MASANKGRMLAVDPGETVGFVLFTAEKILGGGQTPMNDFPMDVWEAFSGGLGPLASGSDEYLRGGVTVEDNTGPITTMVIEKFALYPWKAAEMAWNEFRTSQLIGALKFIARLNEVAVHMQPASIKEAAQAAGAKELYAKPLYENRHQNDACQHAVYFQLSQKISAVDEMKREALDEIELERAI